ncbi:MAG: [protein-PII] uridylyltransferase [Actinomycetota bacterium]|nr:[protein-PII] uridylyltransferase [Actinomycetota bacterium]
MKPVDAATIKRVRAQLVGDPDLAGRSLGRRLSQQADSWFESLAAGLPGGWALLATGGYARGVLAPGSDIDVVLLHPAKTSDALVRHVAESLWYPMWDAGLKLSPAVHSAKSLLQLANADLDTATSVLAVRCLAGDAEVAAEVQRNALEQWRRRPFVWLQRLLESGQQRWARLGDVASLLEPDLKDGRGGLRDFDMIRWALRVDRPDVAAAMEGPVDDLAGPAELLLAIRCELHRTTGRAVNTLWLQDQDRVAEAMGYADADALMLNLAGAAHAIEWATERFWRRVERLIRTGGRTPSRSHVSATLAPGVVVIDDEAHVAADADVDAPSYVFRFAATAAHAGYPLGGRSLRLLASRGVPPGDPWTSGTQRAFVSLLGAGAAMVPAVEALERYGLFSRYLPEWRAVRSLPQRNAFHTFTVDHHLLQTVANAGELVREVARPDLLLVGALMHDLGKGYPGDHTEAGVALIDTVVGRMGFDEADRGVIRALVQHHLLLPETATRRDLSDPRTAANVAETVGDALTLELLHALTEADSRATGPAAWSAWKKGLLDELVSLSLAVLRGGASVPSSLPNEHLSRLAHLVSGDGSVHIEQEDLGEMDLLRIISRDRAGLFAHIAGALALHGLDVVAASAATAADGVAIDEFRIARVAGIVPNWQRVEHDLRGALSGEVDIDARLEQRLRNQSRRSRPQSAVPPRSEVLVSNDASDATTVVEVRAPDAPARLYRLSHALSEYGLDIRSAVVATLGHEVVDVFYVKTPKSPTGKIPVGDFEQVRVAVREALAD